jgi:hypothetical protein
MMSILPEMSARVNFYFESPSESNAGSYTALVVPRDAVTSRDGNQVVFVVEDGKARAATVELGRDLGKTREILSGVTQGEQVIVNPPGKLQPGDKVSLSDN